MAVFELPLRNDLPHFDFTLPLDGVTYRFLFRWNTRGECWYLSLSLEDDTLIWASIKIVVNWPLGKRSASPLAPPGLLMAFDDATAKVDPGLTDLGTRVRVLYFDKESLDALRAEASL